MTDPTTRIEEENKHLNLTEEDILDPHGPRELFTNFGNELPLDEQDAIFRNFDATQAWQELLNLEKQVFMIGPEAQRKMGLLVGVNISQEFAWRRIPYRKLLENVIDVCADTDDRQNLLQPYTNFKMETQILIGYVPVLTQDDVEPDNRDPFVVYYDKDIIRQALDIIQVLEEYEKWVVDRILFKNPRYKWESKGSEQEVNFGAKRRPQEEIDVEMQSVFPLKTSAGELSVRSVADIRDGYAELVPGDNQFDNVFRKRINAAVQARSLEISLEQQTDPTFPTNAWTQYHFKVEEGETGLDVTSEEEESRPASGASKSSKLVKKRPPPPLSDNVEDLLEILNFNQIDMYRNDYTQISANAVPKYSSPYLEEILCFTDLKETLQKKIISIAWYPAISGLVACSYSHLPVCRLLDVNNPEEEYMPPKNQVIIWSLSDSLKYKLQCYAPRGIYTLSFCPYAPQFLVGGCSTGQVILWDLMDKMQKLEDEETLTQAQATYRILMAGYLNWAQPIDEKTNITETVFSDVSVSQTNAISKIDWLDPHLFIATDGKLHRSAQPKHRFFITTSIDGSIAFWDLDIDLSRRMAAKPNKEKLPAALSANESPFRKYDRIFKPVFMICITEPLISNQFDGIGLFDYQPDYGSNKQGSITTPTPIKVSQADKPDRRQFTIERDIEEFEDLSVKRNPDAPNILASSLFGNVMSFNWDGFEYDMGEPVNREKIANNEKYANIHDGPILQMERNPFIRDIFITIGRYIFAIWREDYMLTPIIWRKRTSELTAVAWSIDRPAVFYIGRNDGYFEAWDILARDDEPILCDVLGGGLLTAMAEHRPKVPKKIMAVGDYIGCLRAVALPKILRNSYPNESKSFVEYLEKEVLRKQALVIWEKKWNQTNADIIEARKLAEDEAKRAFEKLKKEEEKEKKIDTSKEEIKPAEPAKKKGVFGLSEKLEKKWEEMNMKRVFEVLMIRKQVNAEKLEIETQIEKRRLAYERSKKIALKKSLANIDEDVAALRARILPHIKEDISRAEMTEAFVDGILKEADPFERIKAEADLTIVQAAPFGDITGTQFFDKGLHRRQLLNKKLGSNLERAYYYETLKENGNLNEIQFDLSRFSEEPEPIDRPPLTNKGAVDEAISNFDVIGTNY